MQGLLDTLKFTKHKPKKAKNKDYFLFWQVIQLWNSLPQIVREVNCVNSIKKSLSIKKYLFPEFQYFRKIYIIVAAPFSSFLML